MAKAESPRPNGHSPRDGISPRNHLTHRTYSPRRQHIDSQKIQLDLEKSFEALRVHDAQAQRLYEYNRRVHNEKAEEKEMELAIYHENALRLEREKRDALAAEAEATLQRWKEQQQEEQRRKAEEEQLRQQREAQAKAERDRQIREEQERLRREEEERSHAEAERQRQEKERANAAEAERQRQALEAKRKEDERKQREATQRAEAAEAAESQRQADAQAQKTATASAAAAAAAAEADIPERAHAEYVALYRKIKAWKNGYWDHIRAEAKARKNPQIKEAVGEARRLIKTEVGKQSYGDKDVNRMAINKIKGCLLEFLKGPTPIIGTRVPVNDFLPPSLQLDDNNASTITDQAAYVLCILTQQVIKIFTSYVHGAPERAEPVGTMLASIFAQPELQFQRSDGTTQSLFPILLAKYHRVCPALFGIAADQSTSAGKLKMGWALMPPASDDQPKTTFVSEQTHYDRMTGLAIGYSSFGLRNFSAATNKNPYPPTHFWQSLAQIVNLPPNQVQPTHVCVLRHMFGHGGIYRFLLFFGSVGVAVLREAFVEFPKRLPESMQKDSYVKELNIYVDNLGEKEHLHLV